MTLQRPCQWAPSIVPCRLPSAPGAREVEVRELKTRAPRKKKKGGGGQNDAELVARRRARILTQEQSAASPLLEVRELSVAYSPRGGMSKTVSDVKAVDGVSFALAKGECLGLVGESGSGKSSIARALVRVAPATGQFLFKGVDFFQLQGEPLRAARREVQLIAQNPRGSIDPRQSAGEVVREPLEVHRLLPRREIGAQVDTLMHQVGFDPALADRRPHQLSGGQCQRLAIARSLAVRAELLICDEPTSALDVSVQAQIINLLKDIQAVDQTSFLFISHDLAVVRQLAHNVAVLYRGRIVELAPAARLFAAPAHPYTVELLSSGAPGHVAHARRANHRWRAQTPKPSCRCRPAHARMRLRATMPVCRRDLPARSTKPGNNREWAYGRMSSLAGSDRRDRQCRGLTRVYRCLSKALAREDAWGRHSFGSSTSTSASTLEATSTTPSSTFRSRWPTVPE